MKILALLIVLFVLWVGCQMTDSEPETQRTMQTPQSLRNPVAPDATGDLFKTANEEQEMRQRLGEW